MATLHPSEVPKSMGDLPPVEDISVFESENRSFSSKKENVEQYVINSKGEREPVDLHKILDNIELHSKGLDVQPHLISAKVIGSFKPGCTTSDLRMESVKEARNFPSHLGDYEKLACRLYLSDLYRKTPKTFSQAMEILAEGEILNDEFWGFVKENGRKLDELIDLNRDQRYNFLSLSTFAQIYMLKVDNKPVERPQYCLLRIATTLFYPRVHKEKCRCPTCEPHEHTETKTGCEGCMIRLIDKLNKTNIFEEQTTFGQADETTWAKIKKRYTRLSHLNYTHASPTMFNFGTRCQQGSSCFLLMVNDDSVDGIYKTNWDQAKISQSGGGVGTNVSNVRARNSRIVTTNGRSNGLVPMLRTYEGTAKKTATTEVYNDDPLTSNGLEHILDEFSEMENRRKPSNLTSTIMQYNATARYMDQCFSPDTIIYTQQGPRRMEDVGTHDKVLSDDGTYQQVNQIVRHEIKKELLNIKLTQALAWVAVTKEHQLLALRDVQNKGHDLITHRLENQWVKIEFVDAGDLKPGDFLVFPIPKFEQDVPSFVEEDCRFYGILLAKGYIKNKTAGVKLSLENETTVEFIRDYCNRRGLGLVETVTNNMISISWPVTNPGFKFVKAQIYNRRDEKRIHRSLINLPLPKTMQIIKGLIETENLDGITLTIFSCQLAEQIRYSLLRMGILSSGSDEEQRIPRTSEICNLFPERKIEKSSSLGYFRYKDQLLSRIEAVETEEYEGIVHDFEVDGNHTYTTHMGIAHNGGGKRKGAFAIYIEPWHADFVDVIEMRLPEGPSETRAPDLFYAVWCNDLFMERVIASDSGKNPVNWSFFCPKQAPGLQDAWGEDFTKLYEKYEAQGVARKTMPVWDIWTRILYCQQKTGIPYMLYKDTVNRRNNHAHWGTVKGSNLCCEIMEVTNKDEVSVCNLASIVLPSCVFMNSMGARYIDYNKIIELAEELVENLNEVIDRTRYPIPEAKYANLLHRPIGIGVQGLADVFHMLKIAYDSVQAQEINHRIFEAIQYGALSGSCKEAKRRGKTYDTYKIKTPLGDGSKVSRGILVFDECKKPAIFNDTVFPKEEGYFDSYKADGSVRTFLNWEPLRREIKEWGVYNSLLVAPMPTASTSKMTGCNESFEAYTANIFDFQTMVGTNGVVNPHLVVELQELGLWTAEIYSKIAHAGGSVQGIDEIPEDVRYRYRTVWELPLKVGLLMAHARGLFIDQSQSFNFHVPHEKMHLLTTLHVMAFLLGLKTGMYYLFTNNPKTKQMQVSQTNTPEIQKEFPRLTPEMCSIINKETCISCQ